MSNTSLVLKRRSCKTSKVVDFEEVYELFIVRRLQKSTTYANKTKRDQCNPLPSFAPIQLSLPNVYLPDKQPFVLVSRYQNSEAVYFSVSFDEDLYLPSLKISDGFEIFTDTGGTRYLHRFVLKTGF